MSETCFAALSIQIWWLNSSQLQVHFLVFETLLYCIIFLLYIMTVGCNCFAQVYVMVKTLILNNYGLYPCDWGVDSC